MSPKAPALLTDARIDELLLLFRMMDQWPTQKEIQCFARAIEAEVRTLAAGEQQPVAWQYRTFYEDGTHREPGWGGWYACGKPSSDELTREKALDIRREYRPLYAAPLLREQNEGSAHPVDAASTTLPLDGACGAMTRTTPCTFWTTGIKCAEGCPCYPKQLSDAAIVAWQHDSMTCSLGAVGMHHIISNEVRDLWLKANPKQVEHYTKPLYDALPFNNPSVLRWALKRLRSAGAYNDYDQEMLAALSHMVATK